MFLPAKLKYGHLSWTESLGMAAALIPICKCHATLILMHRSHIHVLPSRFAALERRDRGECIIQQGTELEVHRWGLGEWKWGKREREHGGRK